MRDPAEKFLTPAERLQIETRIAEAEKRTSGEIVVQVVSSSYHYPLAAMLGSSLLAIILCIAGSLVADNESMWFFLAVFSISFILLHELFKRLHLLRHLFVTASDMKEEVEEAAIHSFYRRNINNTVDHTGIILYISLFERKVRVVADRGINEKVAQDVWLEIVSIIVNGIHAKAQSKAIADAVDRCGEILATHFPLKAGDRNELRNEVIIGRGK
ncbi:MAG: TPM domain-containing protein [Chlorobium sp.]